MAQRGVALVLAARPTVTGIDSVSAENRSTARTLAAHLAASGARSVAFASDPDLSSDVAERLSGIAEGAAEAGMDLQVLLVPSMDEAGGARVAEDLLQRSAALPDAIACANDEIALGLMTALRARGIVAPRDVLVTGWDDIMAARYAELTTVRQPSTTSAPPPGCLTTSSRVVAARRATRSSPLSSSSDPAVPAKGEEQ